MKKSPSGFFELLEATSEKLPGKLEDLEDKFDIKLKGDHQLLQFLKQLCGNFWIDAKYLTADEVIGEGGFGIVEKCRLALPNEIPKIVALKRLKEGAIYTHEDLVEFAEEANLMRKLKCKGLVTLIGIGASNVSSLQKLKETIFVVFEFMGGDTMKDAVYRQMISNGKLYEARDALRWAMQIANAMAYLHSCKPSIIHRDLKLENILLTAGVPAKQKAKVTDLGLHRRMRKDAYEGSVYDGRRFSGSVYSGSVLAAESSRQLRSQRSRIMVPDSDVMEQILANQSQKYQSQKSAAVPDTPRSIVQQSNDENRSESPNTQSKLANYFESQDSSQQQQGEGDEEDLEVKYPIVINDATKKVGSYMYMAPEVYNGNIYNEKVDVFSFGVILYEMMSGKLNVVKIAVTRDEKQVPQYAENVSEGFREQIPVGWPKEMRKLIEDCWAQDYSKRPSFEEIVIRLDDIYLNVEIELVDKFKPGAGYSPTNDFGCCCTIQ